MLELRPDQLDLKRKIYRSIREGNKKVVVHADTSFGKTVLAADIVQDALNVGTDVLFIAPMITLIEQTAEEFKRFGIEDFGIIQADHILTDYTRPVQICSVQSIAALMRRDEEAWGYFQKDKLIIIDEVHILHKTHKAIIKAANKPVVGLSATPWRKGLGKYFDTLLLGPSTRWLIDNGMLSDYLAYSHYVPDMNGVSTNVNGDYSLSESGEKYEPKVIGDIFETWKKYAWMKKTIIFTPRIVDAERFAKEFRDKGINATAVSGYMDQEECYQEVEKFRRGETTVIASVSKLATGFSVRDVECIIDAQPTKSLMRHKQKLGRSLRTFPGKTHAIILDNAGNLIRNGLPDGEYPTTLDDGKDKSKDRRDKEDPLPKPCPKCNFMKPPRAHECPVCGFKPEKQSGLEVEQGELVELSRDKLNKSVSWDEKIKFIGQLKGYAKKYQYKDGWVAHQYRNKFGVWPNDLRVKHAEPLNPESLVINWVKHQAIKRRYAK